MRSVSPISAILSLLLCCAGGGYFMVARSGSSAATAHRRGGATVACGADRADHRRSEAGGWFARSRSTERPASAQLQHVLPGLGRAVGDWRDFTPDAFTVQLAPDLVLPFRVTGVQREHGRTVLTARLAKAGAELSGLDGAFFVSTANTSDRWEAVIMLPGEEYRIHVDRNQAVTEQVLTDGWSCGSNARAGAGRPASVLAMQAPLSGQDASGSLEPAAAAAGGPDMVDVLFLFNPDALAAKHGDVAVIDADCSNFIAAGNAILENSQITNFRWHYLVAVAAPAYPTSTMLQDDLNQLTNGSISAFTERKLSACGADQVVLLVGGWRNDAAGVAWIGGDPNRVAVVYPCLSIERTPVSTATSVIVVCHEMGHNFGCRHDRLTENASDGDGHYCYGFRFADNSGASPVADQGTVMSYAGSRIPYFSNPNIVYHGYALGAPVGDAKAAFNAETMADNAGRIAATNAAQSAPAITGQPQATTVTVGQRVSLSVTATGSSLVCQWFRDGVAVGGATNPTYTVSSAALSDAGSYTVTVSNELDSVTSQPATVTVSVAGVEVGGAASATMTTGSGASGGGAFDGGFALELLALLTLSRRRCRGPCSQDLAASRRPVCNLARR